MYVKVKDGSVVEIGLPQTGYLSDGSGVSNYHLLDADILKAEGWLPLVEDKPGFKELTEQLICTGYTVESDKVIANYRVEQKSPTEADYLLDLDFRLSMIELGL